MKETQTPETMTCPMCYGEKVVRVFATHAGTKPCEFCAATGELKKGGERRDIANLPHEKRMDGVWTVYGPGATQALADAKRKK